MHAVQRNTQYTAQHIVYHHLTPLARYFSTSIPLFRGNNHKTKRSGTTRADKNVGNWRPYDRRPRTDHDFILGKSKRREHERRTAVVHDIVKGHRDAQWSNPFGVDYLNFKPSTGNPFSRTQESSRRQSRGTSRSKRDVPLDELIAGTLEELETSIHQDIVFRSLGLGHDALADAFDTWRDNLYAALGKQGATNRDYDRLKQFSTTCDALTMRLHIKYAFYGNIVNKKHTGAELEDLRELSDLSYPTEWYPATRGFQREFHLHVGPTNSGKTYQALKRLEQAETGLYAGPLRLLAHEVFMRLNAKGQRCNLVTGDDRRSADADPEAPMSSCTVEMIPLNTKLDVAVIDEIQMIGSPDRGWAWTQAVLGVMAKEVHCCGEERAVPIMQELVAMCGEKLHIHRYERLSPLEMASNSLNGSLMKLQKGDCVVAFSVVEIHALRQAIEQSHKTKVAVIYGSLPPETRAQQAQLFNDPDSGYDILVASNAIGMGLNLSIKRLVFIASRKFDGANWSTLAVAEAKQIAGRAGRYSTALQDIKNSTSNLDISNPPLEYSQDSPVRRSNKSNVGYVTTLDQIDYPIIQKLVASDPEPLTAAGIQPPAYVMERFARQFPTGTPFAYLLIRLHDLARTASRFFQCDLRQQIGIADCIEEITGLTTTDRLIFCASPIEPRRPAEPLLAKAYARFVAESRAVRIVDVEELEFDLLGEDYKATRTYLQRLEALHKGVIVWNWLSYRFTGVFVDRPLADHVKSLVEKRIEETLARLSFDYNKIRKSREAAIQELLEEEQTAQVEESKTNTEPELASEKDEVSQRDEREHSALEVSSSASQESYDEAYDAAEHENSGITGHATDVGSASPNTFSKTAN